MTLRFHSLLDPVLRLSALLLVSGCLLRATGAQPSDRTPLVLNSPAPARFRFSGPLGERIDLNLKNWLLPTPAANPGMLEMFRLRDRQPEPDLVPWAGEFAGKYLISAIQSLHEVASPELQNLTAAVVQQLIATQSADGYLGPFPKSSRLKGHWDLWGHYYAMEALLQYYAQTGNPAALASCRKAADLICFTFLNASLRVYDAGSQEMNMAVIHSFAHLYELTREPRYRQLVFQIEKDWERAGDYLRTGTAGFEFFQTPRPRWESLPNLQALLDLFLITGDDRYRTALLHHWRSICRWDRRVTGGFSSLEQATGNPYAATPIETCATVAWIALSIDALKLTGDSQIADQLEIATFNAAAGAQHPSGSWWTYDTPMDGRRAAATQSIAFQARPGTPQLNCCSANGPRSLSLLSEWAVMKSDQGLALNYYGPESFQGKLPDGTPIALQCLTDYPVSGTVEIRVQPVAPRVFTLNLRIPAWAQNPALEINHRPGPAPIPGHYLQIRRRWSEEDRIRLQWDMPVRSLPGDRAALGKAAFFRGPLLLACDQRFNSFPENSLPAINADQLADAILLPKNSSQYPGAADFAPWLLLDLPAAQGQKIRLCDFASAGSKGTWYHTWLQTSAPLPPAVMPRAPSDAALLPIGPLLFRWTSAAGSRSQPVEYQLLICDNAEFKRPQLQFDHLPENHCFVPADQARQLRANQTYFWKIITRSGNLSTDSSGPASTFQLSAAATPNSAPPPLFWLKPIGPSEFSIQQFGSTDDARAISNRFQTALPGQLSMPGSGSMPRSTPTNGNPPEILLRPAPLRFFIDSFPDNYSVAFFTRIIDPPGPGVHQLLSAWTAPLDDPLRITIENGKLSARLEAGRLYSTTPVDLPVGRRFQLAVVKNGADLSLFQNGKLLQSIPVPQKIDTASGAIALGGNPAFALPENLAAEFSDFQFFARPLTPDEIARLSQSR